MATVTLYGKPGCHLCEEALATVREVAAERALRVVEVDVSLDPVLDRRYGERIPVVEVDGEELSQFFVDRRDLVERLDRVGS